MVSAALPAAYRDGSDLGARAALLMGAHLGGQALTRCGPGLVHGIGHALTAHTGTRAGVGRAGDPAPDALTGSGEDRRTRGGEAHQAASPPLPRLRPLSPLSYPFTWLSWTCSFRSCKNLQQVADRSCSSSPPAARETP
ncbi:iron-containing alcohol dehydrogenase [Streptomyces sp. NPDC020996]|uniref:iron-containing alcohol dehydrogenase n=1 Tax=Streptomyces sp. NPDC020996 TaxID=3154791 RepID=UPI0033C0F28A